MSRDILAVGTKYHQHATTEINPAGYDYGENGNSDGNVHLLKTPGIFTKRSTSIIASGEPIYLHSGFTNAIDYGGEIGIIVKKTGLKIEEANAMDYVWGYTSSTM
jgi:2-keto-4-pentenoate hydratase/2-oxohepta-3-ene-1,7-dioic acid hydratase in catechol pathway